MEYDFRQDVLFLEGALDVDSAKNVPLEEAIANSGDMTINGCYVPKKCYSRQKLAVVIPYKDRYEHLLTLVNHLHRILQVGFFCDSVFDKLLKSKFVQLIIITYYYKEKKTM